VWVVLCETNDLPALWAYHGLSERGIAPLELITGDDLLCGLRWRHQIGRGGAEIDITFSDGRTIRGSAISGALNRLVSAPAAYLSAVPADRDYAAQEFFALFMSWLHCLPGTVLNRPTSQGLSGHWRHRSEWAVLAARAGLRTLPYRMTSREVAPDLWLDGSPPNGGTIRNVIVMEGHVIGAPPLPDVVAGCRRLAELSRTGLLGIDLIRDPDGSWLFAAATPQPDLRVGGIPLLDTLATLLGWRSGGS
jgi:hypothetical protein